LALPALINQSTNRLADRSINQKVSIHSHEVDLRKFTWYVSSSASSQNHLPQMCVLELARLNARFELQSANALDLSSDGARSFSVTRPSVYSNLPDHLRNLSLVVSFLTLYENIPVCSFLITAR